MMSQAFYNGHLMPLEEVAISPLDRGFLFGDGVYEVIPCYAGWLFQLEAHLERLDRSLAGIRIDNPLSTGQWAETLRGVVDANGGGDQLVYLQVTRGVAPREHHFPDVEPTVFAMSKPWRRPSVPPPAKVITAADNRWEQCDIKATTLLANAMFRQDAIEAGCHECLLLRNGVVIEGAASNIFVVHNGLVRTPPRSKAMLSGISRQVVLHLLEAMSIPAKEETIPASDLEDCDELWITSSSMEIRPVVRIDDRSVGTGSEGPLWKRVFERFREATISHP